MKRVLAVTFVLLMCLLSMAPSVQATAVPGAPTEFIAERDGTRILLSWGPPTNNVTVLHYNVYRGTEPMDLQFYDHVDANFTAGYDTEVVRGRTYYYAISANGTDGEGPLSSVVKVLPPSDDLPILVMTVILSVVMVTLIFAYWKGRDRE